MYINSGGNPVHQYVYQADRHLLRSYSSNRDYRRHGYGYPAYFGTSYAYPTGSYHSCRPYHAYPVGSYYSRPFYHGYHGYHGCYGFGHGAFSVGGLHVHVRF